MYYDEDQTEISEMAYRIAEEEILTVENFSEWLSENENERAKSSLSNATITNKQLFETFILDPKRVSLTQLHSACLSLRERFILGNEKVINQMAVRISE